MVVGVGGPLIAAAVTSVEDEKLMLGQVEEEEEGRVFQGMTEDGDEREMNSLFLGVETENR